MKNRELFNNLGQAMLATIAGMLIASMVWAQAYPSKPVRLIMPFPPGGPTDAAGRLIAQKLGDVIGQQVVVETRAGASGVPGTEAGAKAAPDGYTLIYGTTSTFSILPTLSKSLPYDPHRSFAPISMVARGPILMAINASVPAQNLREFIALAKAQPNSINYASAGSGTVPHLAAELFKTLTQVELVHVPYKGSGPAQADLVAGRIQVMFDAVAPLAPNIRAGKLRALVIASPQRLDVMPDVPNAVEAGVPQFEMGLWNGILAPAGTPRDIVLLLNGAILKALADPALIEAMARFALVTAGGSPEAFATTIGVEIERWAQAVKVSGAKLE